MNQLNELTTVSCPLLSVAEVSEGVRAYVTDPGATGEFLGCWRTEMGTLGRLLILRGFETAEDLAAERKRALLSSNPFNSGSVVTAVEMDSYAPFPFLLPAKIDILAATSTIALLTDGRPIGSACPAVKDLSLLRAGNPGSSARGRVY